MHGKTTIKVIFFYFFPFFITRPTDQICAVTKWNRHGTKFCFGQYTLTFFVKIYFCLVRIHYNSFLSHVEIWRMWKFGCTFPVFFRCVTQYLDMDETSNITDWQLNVMRPYYLKRLSLNPFWHVKKGNSPPCYCTVKINEKLLSLLIFIWNVLTLLNVKG